MKIKGKVHMFGDNIDTDVIIPAQYCITTDRNLLARYCMNDIRNNFYNSVDKGDILVAGENFGCGSSREAAPHSNIGLWYFLHCSQVIFTDFLSKCSEFGFIGSRES